MFFALGGRIEPGETELECLRREVKEEVGCIAKNPEHFATFEGMNHDNTKTIRMSCYFCELEGNIKPQSEIEECAWINSAESVKVAQMLSLNVIPALIKKGLM